MDEKKMMVDAVDRIMTAVQELGIGKVCHALEEINKLLRVVEVHEGDEVEFKAQYDAINQIQSLPNGQDFLTKAELNKDICSTSILPHSIWETSSETLSYLCHDPSLLNTQEYHTFYAVGNKYLIAQLKIINDTLQGFFVMTMPAILTIVYNGVTTEALTEIIKSQHVKKKTSWFKKIFD